MIIVHLNYYAAQMMEQSTSRVSGSPAERVAICTHKSQYLHAWPNFGTSVPWLRASPGLSFRVKRTAAMYPSFWLQNPYAHSTHCCTHRDCFRARSFPFDESLPV